MTQLRQLRQLRDENARLKRLVADLTLDRHILQEVLKKRAKAGTTTRARSVDPRAISGEQEALVPAEPAAAGMVGILFTQRMMDSPEPPKVFTDFWTLAYAAMG